MQKHILHSNFGRNRPSRPRQCRMLTELSTSLQAKLLKHQELNQRLTRYTVEWGPVVQESKYWLAGFIHSYSLYRLDRYFVIIDRRQGRSREKGKVCGAPWWERSAPFICYLLYAINTLGYSPFCFRLASQILLLVSRFRSVRSARAKRRYQ